MVTPNAGTTSRRETEEFGRERSWVFLCAIGRDACAAKRGYGFVSFGRVCDMRGALRRGVRKIGTLLRVRCPKSVASLFEFESGAA